MPSCLRKLVISLVVSSAVFTVSSHTTTLGDETTVTQRTPVPIQQVTVEDEFWSPKRKIWREVTISDVLTKLEKDGTIRNYDRVRDGQKGGHAGPPFLDGLFCETIRGAADFLASQRDPALEKRIDGYIDHIAAAQAKASDGYLNTSTTLGEPDHRWGLNGGNDVIQHDVYNAGCLVEAAVHYYRATGKTKLLEVAARLTNCMCDVMGPPPKKNMVPGHAVSEEAVTDLYLLFREHPELKLKMACSIDENRYLMLAEFWIEMRGNHAGRPVFAGFAESYDQDHMSVLKQSSIEGHAVRATLMCTGLSALAAVNRRDDYRRAAERLWTNLTTRRMYITGGAGATAEFEAFAPDYVLPNDGYLESCAAVGSAFFSRNMNLLCGDAHYVDEMERVLYNGALCAVSLKGDTYYYQNPLDVKKPMERWAWHGCPCCPPMFLKLMGAMPGYIYAKSPQKLFVNLYVGSTANLDMAGRKLTIRQETRYPWDGKATFTLQCDKPATFDFCLRAPRWCQGESTAGDLYKTVGRPATGAIAVKINGKSVEKLNIVGGYICLPGEWKAGDTIELSMDMSVRRVVAHPMVKADVNRVAVMRGPVVYCVESVGNAKGLENLSLDDDAALTPQYQADLLGGVVAIRGTAAGVFKDEPKTRPISLTLTPYFANANRGPTCMSVWLSRPCGATVSPANIQLPEKR